MKCKVHRLPEICQLAGCLWWRGRGHSQAITLWPRHVSSHGLRGRRPVRRGDVPDWPRSVGTGHRYATTRVQSDVAVKYRKLV